MDLETLKGEVCELLFLKDDSLVDVVCATYVANLLEGDPLWTMIVGAPASGKTEVLMSLRECDGVHIISTLTARTLVSGWQIGGQHGEKRKKGPEASLLDRLKGKLLITKDFTSILSLRPDSQREILSQLREVYDGFYRAEWGTGKTYTWDSTMGFLGGVTPDIYRKHYVMTELGPRFIYYHVERQSLREMSRIAYNMQGKEQVIRQRLRKSFRDFLHHIPRGNTEIANEAEWIEPFSDLAALTALARAPVYRSQGRKVIVQEPDPEGTGRVIKQFKKLAKSLGRLRDTNSIDEDIYRIVRKVGIDSVPKMRWKVLECMWADSQEEGKYDTYNMVTLEKSLRMERSTLSYLLGDLVYLGLIEKEQQRYSLSDDCISYLEGIYATG